VYYLNADLRKECFTEEWVQNACLALTGVALYVAGIPTTSLILLSRNKHKLHSDEKCQDRLGFLFERYEPQCYWWEVTEMNRKLLLCSVIVFIVPGSITQIVSALAIATFFFAIHFKYTPFDEDTDDNLQTVSLASTILTMWGAIILTSKEDFPGTGLILVFINLMVVMLSLYIMAIDTFPTMYGELMSYIEACMALAKVTAYDSDDSGEAKTKPRTRDGEGEAKPVPATANEIKSKADFPSASNRCILTSCTHESATPVVLSIASEEDIQKLFRRYDFDGSGTMNSAEEFKNLVINVTSYATQAAPELHVQLNVLEDAIAKTAPAVEVSPMDLPTFIAWWTTQSKYFLVH